MQGDHCTQKYKHTQSHGVSALHRHRSCDCCLATGGCPLVLCLLEMFVVNKGGEEEGEGGKEGWGSEEGRKRVRREEMMRAQE